MNRSYILKHVFRAILLVVLIANCFAKELLFEAQPANTDYAKGVGRRLADAYRKEFDPRMFPHQTWSQRLAYSSYEPDVNETFEIYTNPDGSHWLCHRSATPSLKGIIGRRIVNEEEFDLRKALNAVPITSHQVRLPLDVAKEIGELWDAMLPGTPPDKVPVVVSTHTPTFDAWLRNGHLVETGRIPMAAYDTPVYRAFVDVIKDLREVCDREGRSNDPIFIRLPRKIRGLRSRL